MTSDADGRPPPDPSPSAPADPSAPAGPGAAEAPILDQAFDADSLYTLRAAVAAHATQAGLSPGRADDLVIAVHELAANAVRHGAGHGRLRLWRSDQALRCEISDDGVPQPAGADGHEDGPADGGADAAQWRTEPGHGLSLVRQVADQTSLRSGPSGTLAAISFALAAPGPPFRLDRRHQGPCTVLAVTGPLDLSSASQLTDAIDALLEQTAENLVLDLDGLTGWDSAGLAALITAQQRISGRPPARMVLAALPAHLAKHLHDAGLADRFTLADTTRAAVSTLT
ncbi:MAG TPA: ATP-binding protein [Streptosporangiaceae bacterium]|nr:ATP-binding protein [Streptosporangiaceae bacterium]